MRIRLYTTTTTRERRGAVDLDHFAERLLPEHLLALFDAVGERRRVTPEDDEVRHLRLQLRQFDARLLVAVPIVEISKLSHRRLPDLERFTDIALERRYGQDIPVLLIDGTEVARHRIGEHDLRLMLAPRGKSAL